MESGRDAVEFDSHARAAPLGNLRAVVHEQSFDVAPLDVGPRGQRENGGKSIVVLAHAQNDTTRWYHSQGERIA